VKTLDTSLQCEQNCAQLRQNALVGYASAGFSFKGEGTQSALNPERRLGLNRRQSPPAQPPPMTFFGGIWHAIPGAGAVSIPSAASFNFLC